MKLGSKNIGKDNSIFFIAEAGINHNGNIDNAKKLIDIAVSSGADCVKFQKRSIDLVYTKELLDSPRESPWGTTQREQKEGLELGLEEYQEINRFCKELNITPEIIGNKSGNIRKPKIK